MRERRTKIVATLGPATDPPGILDGMVAAGVDCLRLNCSHATGDELRRRAAEVRTAAAKAGRPLPLLWLSDNAARAAAGARSQKPVQTPVPLRDLAGFIAAAAQNAAAIGAAA